MIKYYISHIRTKNHFNYSGDTLIDYWADCPWCPSWRTRDFVVSTYYKIGATRPSRPVIGAFRSLEREVIEDLRNNRCWFFRPVRRFSSRRAHLREVL